MPIFEYRCSACAHLEEVLQKHTDPAPDACPHCGKQGTLAKELSRSSFQLKGGGWYKDLYASAKPGDSSSSSSASSSSSTPSAATSPATSSASAPAPAAAAPAPAAAAPAVAAKSPTAA